LPFLLGSVCRFAVVFAVEIAFGVVLALGCGFIFLMQLFYVLVRRFLTAAGRQRGD
jgi:hypothetical protein